MKKNVVVEKYESIDLPKHMSTFNAERHIIRVVKDDLDFICFPSNLGDVTGSSFMDVDSMIRGYNINVVIPRFNDVNVGRFTVTVNDIFTIKKYVKQVNRLIGSIDSLFFDSLSERLSNVIHNQTDYTMLGMVRENGGSCYTLGNGVDKITIGRHKGVREGVDVVHHQVDKKTLLSYIPKQSLLSDNISIMSILANIKLIEVMRIDKQNNGYSYD